MIWRSILGTALIASVQANIRGISWYGLETEHKNLMCCWANDISWHLQKMESLGFNSVRVPFAYQNVQDGNWTVLDSLFAAVRETNLTIVLDFHRIENTHQSAKPYTDNVTFDHFLGVWETVLRRYAENPHLVAVDIFNEYQPDNTMEWGNLARQICQFIETRFPGRLVYYVQGVKWGGDLHYVHLEDLQYSDRILYSIHKYYFTDKEPLEESWDWSFGPHKTVVTVGEWGYISNNPRETAWAERFAAWLKLHGIRNTYFWTWSPNSDDTGGILLDNCLDVDGQKMAFLQRFWT